MHLKLKEMKTFATKRAMLRARNREKKPTEIKIRINCTLFAYKFNLNYRIMVREFIQKRSHNISQIVAKSKTQAFSFFFYNF